MSEPTTGPARDAVSVFHINGKKFVAGLVWKRLKNGLDPRAEAKRIGKSLDKQMVTIRTVTNGKRKTRQAGFAPRTGGRMRGMYSLAATLCGTLGENFVAVFEVDADRYVLVAAREGEVVSGRDAIGDRETIEKLLKRTHSDMSKLAEFANSGRQIAPAVFEFYQDNSTLTDVLPKRLKSEYRLKPLTMGLSGRDWALVAIAMVVVALSIAGVQRWLENKELEEQARLLRAQQARTLAEARAAQANVVKPWEMLPPIAPLLEACAKVLDDTPLSIAGWRLSMIECFPQQVEPSGARYVRADQSPLEVFEREAADRLGAQPVVLSPVEAALSFRIEVKGAGEQELLPVKQVEAAMASYLQAFGDLASFTLAAKAPPAADPNVEPDPEIPRPTWQTTEFTISTNVPPETLLANLDQPGLTIHKVTTTLAFDEAVLTWHVRGEIYGK